MPHLVLLGDSVFDNASYVPPGRTVLDALRDRLGSVWELTLLAQDGSTIDEIERQLLAVPSDATHLVLSTGGNDVLAQGGILSERTATVGEALWRLGQLAEDFTRRYRSMLRKVRGRGLPITVCTIYGGSFSDEHLQLVTGTALAVFDDALVRSVRAAGLPLIELRDVCTDPEDYVGQIEPSARGSERIAGAIVEALIPGTSAPHP
jgi:hypothetical protein